MLFGDFLWHKVGDSHRNWEINNLWNLLSRRNYSKQISPGIFCRKSLLSVLQPLTSLSAHTTNVRFSTALCLWTQTSEHCNVLQGCRCPHQIICLKQVNEVSECCVLGLDVMASFWIVPYRLCALWRCSSNCPRTFPIVSKNVFTLLFSLDVWFLINDNTPCSSHVSLLYRLVCIIAMSCYFLLFHYGS